VVDNVDYTASEIYVLGLVSIYPGVECGRMLTPVVTVELS